MDGSNLAILGYIGCSTVPQYGRSSTARVSNSALRLSGAARGKGEASPYGWTSKNYVICVCAFTVMELLRIARQIHCKAVEQRATLLHRQYNRSVVTPLAEWTPGAVCDMPSCPAVLATLRLSRKPKHQPPPQLPVSACLLFQFLIKMRCSLYWYAERCLPPPWRTERPIPHSHPVTKSWRRHCSG